MSENLYVLMQPIRTLMLVKSIILVPRTQPCVSLFVTKTSQLLLVFLSYALDQDSLPIQFVARLMNVNTNSNASIKSGWLMIVSRDRYVVLLVFVEINVDT